MENSEFKKSTPYHLVDKIDYMPHAVVIKSIFGKITGSVTLSSFDTGEDLLAKSSPYDSLIQIIEGEAEIVINEKSCMMQKGQSIIIPAHAKNRIKANTRFKMLSTVIKSGYDDVSL